MPNNPHRPTGNRTRRDKTVLSRRVRLDGVNCTLLTLTFAIQNYQVCVQPRPSAVKITLPAFAALRRAAGAVPSTMGAAAAQRWRLISIDVSRPMGA